MKSWRYAGDFVAMTDGETPGRMMDDDDGPVTGDNWPTVHDDDNCGGRFSVT